MRIVEHGQLVLAKGLIPAHIFAGGAVEQPTHRAALEFAGGHDHGARGIGVELALALVSAAGQVAAVGELKELIVLVVAHDGAHRPGTATRDVAGTVAAADVDFLVVAVAQDAAHATGAVHRNSAPVGAVKNMAGADIGHDAGHAVGIRRILDVAGVEAVLHLGFMVSHHGAHHAADVALAGGDGDVHLAGHAADGAGSRSGAKAAHRAAHLKVGGGGVDDDGAVDGEAPDGAGDVTEQAGVSGGVFNLHVADGVACAVEGAGVDGRCVADGCPCFVGQVDIRGQHRAGGGILCRALQRAVDQGCEPEELAGVGDFIHVPIQVGGLVLLATSA